ncbi:hypothetical protein KAT92_05095, partial [Candidatus Babeliales bacterium]|nr:hypothetical protein [Candidatus Babeliales bacterium]
LRNICLIDDVEKRMSAITVWMHKNILEITKKQHVINNSTLNQTQKDFVVENMARQVGEMLLMDESFRVEKTNNSYTFTITYLSPIKTLNN